MADAERLNRRMHNKLWIADNAAAVIGSRNLGNAYFDGLESGNFSDIDLFAMGPIVGELSGAFDAYWNSASAVPIERLGAALDAAAVELSRPALRSRAAACEAFCVLRIARAVRPGPDEADWLRTDDRQACLGRCRRGRRSRPRRTNPRCHRASSMAGSRTAREAPAHCPNC